MARAFWFPVGALFFGAYLMWLGLARYGAEAIDYQAGELRDRGQLQQARIAAEAAARMDPFQGYCLYRVAELDAMEAIGDPAGKGARALESMRRALPLMPHRANALRLLGQVQYATDDFEGAVATLESFFRELPSPPTSADVTRRLLGMALFRSGRHGEAAVAMTEAMGGGGSTEDRLSMVAPRLINALMLNQGGAAEAVTRGAAFLAPGRVLSDSQVDSLFREAIARNKFAALVKALVPVVEIGGTGGVMDPRLAKRVAIAQVKLGNLGEALALMRRLKAQQPADAEIPLAIGDFELARGNRDAAVEAYREHLKLTPASPFREDIRKKLGGDP